jgi:hypothetical protein
MVSVIALADHTVVTASNGQPLYPDDRAPVRGFRKPLRFPELQIRMSGRSRVSFPLLKLTHLPQSTPPRRRGNTGNGCSTAESRDTAVLVERDWHEAKGCGTLELSSQVHRPVGAREPPRGRRTRGKPDWPESHEPDGGTSG